MTELRTRIQHALGDQFDIERELGGGGMSRVFVAHDTRLERRVVVKLLRPELAVGVSVERFRREILLAASLQHPLIVPVLAAGEIDGLPYFLMPFVDGESLRMRLHRSGTLSVPETVRILRDVARALAVAHARGIVHRDIKPDNVLLAHDAAVVADFGVAKAFASARAGDDSPSGSHHAITTVGTSLGTPAYMAPEQVAADPAAGHAIDIYAVGIMAYEMLTGATPFAGRAPQAIMAAHITERPVPLADVRPGLPTALTSMVMRCLAKDAHERPDAAALVAILEDPAVVSGAFTPVPDEEITGARANAATATPATNASGATQAGTTNARVVRGGPRTPLVFAGGVVIALLVALFAWSTSRDSSGPSRGNAESAVAVRTADLPPSVAILPFVYLGADSTQSWTARAVADAITNGVSSLAGVRVASRGSAEALQRRLASGDTTALPVRTLVEGVLEHEGTRLRLSVRLVDAVDGFTIFADRYEGDAGNLFAMEDVMAASIRDMLREHFGLPANPADTSRTR